MTSIPSMIDEARARDVRDTLERDLGEPEHASGKWNFYHCPFPDHREKTASFATTHDGYKCFGSCGRRGDLIDWYVEYHRLSFVEALEKITGKVSGEPGDPAEYARLAIQRAERVRVALEVEIAKATQAIAELRAAEKWLTYHEQAGELGEQHWVSRGIPVEFQKFWQLGYCSDYPLWKKKGDEWLAWWHSPSLSIPIRNHTWEVMNVKHRLENVPTEGGKYRYEKKNIPAQPFLCFPDQPTGPLFLTEGEIKAMVTCTVANSPKMQFAGMPAIRPDEGLFEALKGYDPIYFCADPDAYSAPEGRVPPAWTVIKQLGPERVFYIQLPQKIDDLIIRYNLGSDWVASLCRTARRAK